MFKNNGKKICATIEARMTSSRLPGKVLMDFCGKPSLVHIIERLKRSRYIDEICVATTTNDTDNPIVSTCEEINCKYFRGSEEDVSERVLLSAKSVDADIIVEITGDCPVIDWRHADRLIEIFFSSDYDYVANNIKRSFPRGFDTQVFPVSVLDEVNRLTKCPVDHEHVSLYIYSHPERFKIFNLEAEHRLNHPEIEVTLDTPEDYELISRIYENLYYSNKDFTAYDVVDLILAKPELVKIVENVKRKDPFYEKRTQGTAKT